MNCFGESLEVTLGQDSVVLGIAVMVELLNSVTDEADLTLESLDPVGRGGRSSMVGGSHWNEKLVKTNVGKDEGHVARTRSLSTYGTCIR